MSALIEGGSPTQEEAAAILAALEVVLAAAPRAGGMPATPRWRAAARLLQRPADAWQGARDAWRLTRLR
ncbi:hypothetical protein EPN42_09410 [bacterium]|nr:MAG: hypothetical protein EPN42_09410 [bacterium]